MITNILIGLLFAGEVFFLAWNLKCQTPHRKEKMIFKIVCIFILCLLLLTGLLEGLTRYGILIAVLLLQAHIC